MKEKNNRKTEKKKKIKFKKAKKSIRTNETHAL
jgi:hypothetical protein